MERGREGARDSREREIQHQTAKKRNREDENRTQLGKGGSSTRGRETTEGCREICQVETKKCRSIE